MLHRILKTGSYIKLLLYYEIKDGVRIAQGILKTRSYIKLLLYYQIKDGVRIAQEEIRRGNY